MSTFSKKQFLQLHSRFFDLLKEESCWHSKLLPYHSPESSGNTKIDGSWMIFHESFRFFTRELLNGINQFSSTCARLTVWSQILGEIDNDTEKLGIVVENVTPLFRLSMDYPYALKSHFIYASVKLLQMMADKAKLNIAEFDESGIHRSTLDTFEPLADSIGQALFDNVRQKIDEIHQKDFMKAVRAYRHRFHHRSPPYLEIGERWNVIRKKDEAGVSYEFGVEYPIKIASVMPLLADQHRKSVEAFAAYRSLFIAQKHRWEIKA